MSLDPASVVSLGATVGGAVGGALGGWASASLKWRRLARRIARLAVAEHEARCAGYPTRAEMVPAEEDSWPF